MSTAIVVYRSRCPVSTTQIIVTELSSIMVVSSPGAYRPVDLILEPRDGFLLAIALGQLSFREAVESCQSMCDLAAGLGLRKILLDCLAVEGDLSPDERFELGKTTAEYCQSQLRIPALALIGKPPAVTGLGARAASNRGMPVEIFSDRQQGLDWLKSRP